MARGAETQMRVLVTVKAYPGLSRRYGETVCVAGVRTDLARPEWIRLYPVGYRDLPFDQRFKKYQLVDLRARRGSDLRPESWKPNLGSMALGEVVGTGSKWKDRWELLEPLAGATTTCALLRAQGHGSPTPSLGMIKPLVDGLTVEPNPDFDADRQRLAELAASEDLFGSQRSALEPMPYRLRYQYRCDGEPSCPRHTQSVIDWEAGAAARTWRAQGYEESSIPDRLRARWLEEMCSDEKDTYFFVGNQLLAPRSFLVLGVFWPPTGSRPEPGLFR